MPMRTIGFSVALLLVAAAPAWSDSLDVLKGQFAFNWKSDPAKQKCVKVADKLWRELSASGYHCNLKPTDHIESDGPYSLCTQKGDGKEYLIFPTKKACDDERETQASNE